MVARKSGSPETDTRIVLLFGNPTMARCARPPAAIELGVIDTPGGALGVGCSTAAASPAVYVMLPPSKFCRCKLPVAVSSLTGIPKLPAAPPMAL